MPFPTEKELVDSAIKHFPLRKWLQVNEHDKVFLDTEVQGLFGIPDLVAAIPPHRSNVDGSPVLTMAFEMKLSDWRRGLAQAFRYRTFANSSFLVIDEARSKQAVANLERFQRANVGLIGLKADGSFLIHWWPEQEEPFSPELHAAFTTILEEAYVMPWRRSCRRLERPDDSRLLSEAACASSAVRSGRPSHLRAWCRGVSRWGDARA